MSMSNQLQGAWQTVQLGEVAKFINGDRGKNYPSQDAFVSAGIPFINAGHIKNGNIDFESMNYISGERFDLLGSGKVQCNDILYCLRGSLGKTAVIRAIEEGAIASSLVIIRPSNKIDTDYLYHYLVSPRGKAEIWKYDNGSSQPNLSAKSVKGYKIPLPPLEEQKRIAAILEKADAIRRKRKEAIALTEELLRSTFLDMFGDPLSSQSDSILLGECAEVIMGQSPPGSSYNQDGDGTPLLNGPTEFGKVHPIEQQWTTTPKKFCRANDVLFCVRGATAGRLNMADKDYCIGRGVAAIRPKSTGNYNSSFIYAILERYYDYFQRRGVGSTFINISRNELTNLPIPKSNISSLNNFSSIYRNTQRSLDKLNQYYQQADNLFNTLLQKAFCGEL